MDELSCYRQKKSEEKFDRKMSILTTCVNQIIESVKQTEEFYNLSESDTIFCVSLVHAKLAAMLLASLPRSVQACCREVVLSDFVIHFDTTCKKETENGCQTKS